MECVRLLHRVPRHVKRTKIAVENVIIAVPVADHRKFAVGNQVAKEKDTVNRINNRYSTKIMNVISVATLVRRMQTVFILKEIVLTVFMISLEQIIIHLNPNLFPLDEKDLKKRIFFKSFSSKGKQIWFR